MFTEIEEVQTKKVEPSVEEPTNFVESIVTEVLPKIILPNKSEKESSPLSEKILNSSSISIESPLKQKDSTLHSSFNIASMKQFPNLPTYHCATVQNKKVPINKEKVKPKTLIALVNSRVQTRCPVTENSVAVPYQPNYKYRRKKP